MSQPAVVSAADEKHVEYTIDLLNGRLADGTIAPDDIIKLYKLCMSRKKKAIANLCVVTGMFLSANAGLSFHQTLEVALCVFHYWWNDGFMSKGHYRINVTTERRNLIEDAVVMLASLDERKHPDYADLVEFNLAMALESSGDFVKALAVYSDLITKEAYVGVDLSLIIFRAAVILLHLGRDAQAIDYLDFIQEDAPIKSGYGRAHVLALLYIVYESRGRKFAHMLEAVNTAFQHIREDEMPFLLDYADRNRPNSSEATSVHRFITFSTAKIWEALALQAMSKGDYVYAIEMLKQLLRREPPSPSGVYLTLSEAYYVLGEKDIALRAAEASFDIESQNVEVRNMLLLIAPEKWQEQLRLAAPVRVMKVAVIEDDEPLDENDIRSRLVQRKGVGGNSPDKEKPREVIPLVGGEWLTHKLTPFDKNFKSPTDSPVRTPAPSIQSSALHTPAHSEFDVADLFSNPTTRANSHTNSPRLMSSDKDSMGGGITESEKMKIVSDKLRSKGAYDAIQAARKKSLRPEKPSFAMDEATKQMLQAMLMTEDPTSISMTVPTYDLINKRLAAPQQVKHGIGSVIIEGDDDEEGDDLSTGDKASSWLFRSADVGETPVNPDSLQSSGIAFKSR